MTPLRPCVHGRAACVLVVDDETDNTEVLEIILTWEGVRVMTAHSGEVALALVAQSAPDLIMLDVMMPGIDGYEVATRLKADLSTTHIPIIIFTAMAQRDARERGKASGADEILSKPLDRSELVGRVRALLRATYEDYSEAVPVSA